VLTNVFKVLLLATLLSPVSLAAKNVPELADFQQSVQLGEAKKRFRSFDLPAEVLFTLQRADLGDLRVFDNEGRAMPFQIRRKKSDRVSEQKALSFYPLPGVQDTDGVLAGVDIERNAGGDVIRIHPRKQPLENVAELPVTQYLLENQETETDLDQLIFNWFQTREGQVSLKIEHSDNLVQWRSLVQKAVLARLQHNGDQLELNTIDLPYCDSRFLRITLLDADIGFRIEEVSAQYQQVAIPVQNWLALGQLKKQQDESGVYGFNIRSEVKPEKIQLVLFGDSEFYLSGKLYSRQNKKSDWRLRNRQFVQYALKQDEQWFKSEALPLGYTGDAAYRLELKNGQDLPDAEKLKIQLLMPSYEVVFIAAGKSPFILAWGNANIESDNYSMEPLFEQFNEGTDELEKIQLERSLYLKDMEQPQADAGIDWKSIVLWSVLALGVLLAGLMAFQLKNELSQNTDPGDSA